MQTDARLWSAAAYYAVLARMPAWLAYMYAAVAGIGALTILWSLRDGRAGNLMFDGGSICAYTIKSVMHSVLIHRLVLYGAATYVYMHDVLPSECRRALTSLLLTPSARRYFHELHVPGLPLPIVHPQRHPVPSLSPRADAATRVLAPRLQRVAHGRHPAAGGAVVGGIGGRRWGRRRHGRGW